MMHASSHRPRSFGIAAALLLTTLLPHAAVAQHSGPIRWPWTASARGVITATTAATNTLQLAVSEVQSASVRVATGAAISKGGQTAAFSALAAGDFVELLIDRRTGQATRVEVNAAPAITISGYLTALDVTAGTFQVTTTRGTAITLKTAAATRIRLQGRTVTLAGLAVGEIIQARYGLVDKTASAVEAQAPRTLFGTLVGIDLAARTVQYTTLGGVTNTVSLTPNTILRLNGRAVTSTALQPGYPVNISLNLANNSAIEVSAVTPALLELLGSVTSLDPAAGTVIVGTPFGTAITLRTTVTTATTLNGAASALANLAPGDRVTIGYQNALPPGVATALRITATR